MVDWKDDWQEVVEAVGTDFGDGRVHYGAEIVERSGVRRYLEPLEFDCPLHYDTEVARRHGYPDIIAPYTAILPWSTPPMWVPGSQPLFTDGGRDAQPSRTPLGRGPLELGPATTGLFATEVSLDFVRPITLGDRVGRRGHVLLDCSLKETSVGRGAFTTWGSEIVDEKEEVVARLMAGSYAYEPVAAAAAADPAPVRPGEESSTTTAPPVGASGGADVTRTMSDVQVGQELAPVAFPLTLYRLVMEAGANRDFNSIHHNTEYARSTGAQEMYANNTFLSGMWERAVRDWIGPAGTIRSIRGFRMRSFNYVGDTTVVRGHVSAVDAALGEVTLAMRSENSSGLTVGPGSVVVSLPSRQRCASAR